MSKKLLYVSSSALALCLIAGGTAFAATISKAPFKANAARALMATVDSVSGTTLTVTARGNNSAVTTIDVSKAKVFVNGVAADATGIKTGDKIIALGTVSGTALTATRVTDGAGKTTDRGVMSGVVTAVSGNTVTISENQHARVGGKVTTSQTSVTVTTDSKTMFNVPGTKNASIGNVKVGDRVSVMGVDSTGSGTAHFVSVMPVAKKTK